MLEAQKISLITPYNLYEPIIKLIGEFEPVREPESIFLEEVEVSFVLEPEKIDKFEKSLQELSSGKVNPKYLEKDYLLKRLL